MRPTMTTSSPSLAAWRTSLTGLAPDGSSASKYLVPSAAGAFTAGGCDCAQPASTTEATVSVSQEIEFRIGDSRSRGWSNRFQSVDDQQAHGPDGRRDGPDDAE